MKKSLALGLILGLFIIFLINGVYAADIPATQQTETKNAINPQEQAFLDAFENAGRFLFKIPANELVDVSYLVVMIALFIVLAFIISNAISFVSFFSGWKAQVAGVIVTILAALSGGISQSAKLFLSFRDPFGTTSTLGKMWFLIIVVVLFIVLFGATKLLSKLKETLEIDKAENLGLKTATNPLTLKLKEKGIIK